MRLTHIDYGLELMLEENSINVIVIENPTALSALAGDLWHQIQGHEGGWILSDGTCELNISKSLECIFNPFAIDLNNKRVINAIYKDLVHVSSDMLFTATSDINSKIANYIGLITSTSEIPLEYGFELNVSDLLKLYNVKACNDSDNLVDTIIEYIKVMRRIAGITVFAFINFKSYFNTAELKMIYESSLYEKVNLIMIESFDNPVTESEKKIIIDNDRCIVEL